MPWIHRSMEVLWVLTVVLVPLAFLGRSYGEWSSIIGSYELPKITILRTAAGLLAVLWLLEWALKSGSPGRAGLKWLPLVVPPALSPRRFAQWLSPEPARWLTLAVVLYIGSTLLSTVLSTSFGSSLWGDVPGQDSYSFYTVISYCLLFGVIATHLKTEAQLWRLLGAIVLMGVLASGYAVFQHYGWDFLDLIEPFGHTRSTSTFGRTIFAGAVLLMTIPVTILAAARSLTGRMTVPSFTFIAIAWAMVLGVQLLGTIFIASRGPWVGTLAGLAALAVLVAVFTNWRLFSRGALVLALGTVLAIAVFVSPLQSIADESIAARAETRPELSDIRSLGTSGTGERLASIASEAAATGLAGRTTIWGNAWELITDRPWFGFDHLSVSFLRPLVGYGPEQFRTTYLLLSPPNPAANLLPNEVVHAHNFFLQQGVETGFLGLFTSAGLFLAVFASGAYYWFRQRNNLSVIHKLVLAGMLAAISGRLLEQMVGVARVSDLMLFWVLLAVLAALPSIFKPPGSAGNVESVPRLEPRPGVARSRFLPGLVAQPQQALRWMAVLGLIVGLSLLIWNKNIDYVRSAVIADQAAEQFRTGELDEALRSIDRSIDLSPDVSTYYFQWSQVYGAHRSAMPAPECDEPQEISADSLCLNQRAYSVNTQWVTQRPYEAKSKLALANSALALGLLNDDTELQDQSVQIHREAAAMVPNSWVTWNRLGDVLVALDRPEAALDALNKSLAITGSSSALAVEGLAIQGMAYRQLGQLQNALQSLDQALQAGPASTRALLERGRTRSELGQPDRALPDANEAVRQSPNSAEAHHLRGTIYYNLGRLETAVAELTNAINLNPQMSVAWNSRGLALARLGQLAPAIGDFSEAIRLDPELSVAYNNRGFAYRDTGDVESAIQDLDKAIELDPDLAIFYYNRALAYVLLGKDAEARQDGQRAVDLGFDAGNLDAAINEFQKRRQ